MATHDMDVDNKHSAENAPSTKSVLFDNIVEKIDELVFSSQDIDEKEISDKIMTAFKDAVAMRKILRNPRQVPNDETNDEPRELAPKVVPNVIHLGNLRDSHLKLNVPPRNIDPQDLYLTLFPANNTTGRGRMVGSTIQVYTSRRTETRVIIERWLSSIEWHQVFLYVNNTDSPVEKQVRFLTRHTVANGSEFSREVGLSASFRGLGFQMGSSRKTFSSEETVTETERTFTYTIPPRTSLVVYQRRYHFKIRLWYHGWVEFYQQHNPFTVGSWDSYDPSEAIIDSYIDADETLASDVRLTGQLAIEVTQASITAQLVRRLRRNIDTENERVISNIERQVARA